MINYPFTPYKSESWTPLSLSNQKYWYRSDDVILSGSDVTVANQKFPAGVAINANFFGTLPTQTLDSLNQKPSLNFDLTTVATLTDPSTTQVVDESSVFTLAYVVDPPTLSSGTFYGLLNLAGVDDTNSPHIFYTNLPGLPNFYMQIGNGTVIVVGADFDISQPHSAILTYDGGGYANSTSWNLLINGISQTISVISTTGGGGNTNVWGDNSGGGATPPFYYYELLLVGLNNAGNLANLLNYFNARYGL